MDAIRLVRHELDGRTPLIGFSGAPFTLASYIVEGGHSRNYAYVKKFMYEDPVGFGRLMSLISEVVVDYLLAQIAAGAQVVQLFDSWVGWLGPYDYELLVLPHVRYVIDKVKGQGAPVIYFGNGASAMLAPRRQGRQRGHRRGLAHRARPRLGAAGRRGHPGQPRPASRCSARPRPSRSASPTSSRRAGGRPGHIFNLGHGLVPQTPPDNVKYLVDAVHRLSAAPI